MPYPSTNIFASDTVKLRRLQDHEQPLLMALAWGTNGIENRSFVLQENDTGDILVSLFHFLSSSATWRLMIYSCFIFLPTVGCLFNARTEELPTNTWPRRGGVPQPSQDQVQSHARAAWGAHVTQQASGTRCVTPAATTHCCSFSVDFSPSCHLPTECFLDSRGFVLNFYMQIPTPPTSTENSTVHIFFREISRFLI